MEGTTPRADRLGIRRVRQLPLGHPSRLLHPRHLPKKIQRHMCRRHNSSMGATERKRYEKIRADRMQAHRVRRERKAKRKRMAEAGQGNGYRRKWRYPRRPRYGAGRATLSNVEPKTAEEMNKRKCKLPGKQCWAAMRSCGPKVRIGNTLCIMIKVDKYGSFLCVLCLLLTATWLYCLIHEIYADDADGEGNQVNP